MANNTKFSNVEKQIFTGDYPLVSEALTVVTAVKAGDVIGVSATGTYGKYDKSVTYTTPYAIAYEDADAAKNCSCILAACLVESFVLLPVDTTEKLKLKQELRKIGLFLK